MFRTNRKAETLIGRAAKLSRVDLSEVKIHKASLRIRPPTRDDAARQPANCNWSSIVFLPTLPPSARAGSGIVLFAMFPPWLLGFMRPGSRQRHIAHRRDLAWEQQAGNCQSTSRACEDSEDRPPSCVSPSSFSAFGFQNLGHVYRWRQSVHVAGAQNRRYGRVAVINSSCT